MGITEDKKETFFLVLGLVFVSSVFFFNLIQVYNASDVVKETTFKVFDVYNQNVGRTYVLTYGDGKYIFIGNHTDEFELDHTYHITYLSTKSPHTTMANPPRYFLKILTITEIPT